MEQESLFGEIRLNVTGATTSIMATVRSSDVYQLLEMECQKVKIKIKDLIDTAEIKNLNDMMEVAEHVLSTVKSIVDVVDCTDLLKLAATIITNSILVLCKIDMFNSIACLRDQPCSIEELNRMLQMDIDRVDKLIRKIQVEFDDLKEKPNGIYYKLSNHEFLLNMTKNSVEFRKMVAEFNYTVFVIKLEIDEGRNILNRTFQISNTYLVERHRRWMVGRNAAVSGAAVVVTGTGACAAGAGWGTLGFVLAMTNPVTAFIAGGAAVVAGAAAIIGGTTVAIRNRKNDEVEKLIGIKNQVESLKIQLQACDDNIKRFIDELKVKGIDVFDYPS